MDMGVWGGGDSGAHFSETGVDGIRGLVEQLAFDACTITTYKRHKGDEVAGPVSDGWNGSCPEFFKA